VPLGARIGTAIVVENQRTQNQNQRTPNENPERRTPNAEPRAAVKPRRTVLDSEPFVPSEVVDLAKWTAEYYAAGVGDTIPMLLPPMARGARADAHKTVRMASLTPAGLDVPSGELTDKQRDLLALLAGIPTGI